MDATVLVLRPRDAHIQLKVGESSRLFNTGCGGFRPHFTSHHSTACEQRTPLGTENPCRNVEGPGSGQRASIHPPNARMQGAPGLWRQSGARTSADMLRNESTGPYCRQAGGQAQRPMRLPAWWNACMDIRDLMIPSSFHPVWPCPGTPRPPRSGCATLSSFVSASVRPVLRAEARLSDCSSGCCELSDRN